MLPLNEFSGNRVRRSRKPSGSWPESLSAKELSSGVQGLGSGDSHVASAALRSILKTGTETGDIEPLLPQARSRPPHVAKLRPKTSENHHPLQGTHHGYSSRPVGLGPQPQWSTARTAAHQNFSAAGLHLHRPLRASQGASYEPYSREIQKHPQVYYPRSAQTLPRQRSYGSLRGQPTTVPGVRPPSPLYFLRRVKRTGARPISPVSSDLSGRYYQGRSLGQPGPSLRTSDSASSSSISTSYGKPVHDHVRLVDRPARNAASAIIGPRPLGRPAPWTFTQNIHIDNNGTTPLSHRLVESGFGRGVDSLRPPLPVFYDYTEDFGEEEFHSAKGSIVPLQHYPINEGVMKEETLANEFENQQMSSNSAVTTFADTSDELHLESAGSTSDQDISGLPLLKESMQKWHDIKQEAYRASVKHRSAQPSQDIRYRQLDGSSSSHENDREMCLDEQVLQSHSQAKAAQGIRTKSILPGSNSARGFHKAVPRKSHGKPSQKNVYPENPLFSHNFGRGYGGDKFAAPERPDFEEWTTATETHDSSHRLGQPSLSSRDLVRYYRRQPLTNSSANSLQSISESEAEELNHDEVKASDLKHDHSSSIDCDPERPVLESKVPARLSGDDGPMLLSKTSFPWLRTDDPLAIDSLMKPPSTRLPSISTQSSPSSSEEEASRNTHVDLASRYIDQASYRLSMVEGDLSTAKQQPSFKAKVRRSDVDKATSSERCPWNLDESYPWVGASPDIQIELPKPESQPSPSLSKPSRFKYRNFKTSSAARFIRFRKLPTLRRAPENITPGAISTIEPGGEKHITGVPECVERKHGQSSQTCCLKQGHNVNEDQSQPAIDRGGETRLEIPSFVSDDSSEHHRPSSIRDRLNSLRARFADTDAPHVKDKSMSDPKQSTNTKPMSDDIASVQSKRWNVVEKIKRWIARRKRQALRLRRRLTRERPTKPLSVAAT